MFSCIYGRVLNRTRTLLLFAPATRMDWDWDLQPALLIPRNAVIVTPDVIYGLDKLEPRDNWPARRFFANRWHRPGVRDQVSGVRKTRMGPVSRPSPRRQLTLFGDLT